LSEAPTESMTELTFLDAFPTLRHTAAGHGVACT
jgi:hypothetical protein